ncbi:MAG: hypothetical protein KKG25_16325 [Bacteroidetes bacterium]|nr:hypothetical protein [Bacteroidota bacterium]MBU1486416.1 hypothetical protein [Bacteroidota bacterium]
MAEHSAERAKVILEGRDRRVETLKDRIKHMKGTVLRANQRNKDLKAEVKTLKKTLAETERLADKHARVLQRRIHYLTKLPRFKRLPCPHCGSLKNHLSKLRIHPTAVIRNYWCLGCRTSFQTISLYGTDPRLKDRCSHCGREILVELHEEDETAAALTADTLEALYGNKEG